MEILLILGIVVVVMLVWINILATIAVRCDHTLEPFQKNVQLLLVWLIPIFGASIVLRLVFDHSPEAIPKAWIPWPLKNLIFGKQIKSNKNRDDNELDTYPGSTRSGNNYGGSASNNEGGGGD